MAEPFPGGRGAGWGGEQEVEGTPIAWGLGSKPQVEPVR